jgi:hypothetical protein
LPAHLEAVDRTGQADVKNHQPWLLPGDGGEPLLPVHGLDDPVPVATQVHFDEVGDVPVVFDHHDRSHLRGHVRTVCQVGVREV